MSLDSYFSPFVSFKDGFRESFADFNQNYKPILSAHPLHGQNYRCWLR